jgi:peptidoglycan/xylan/chitin deacetylase (PgdA/CDA1 family)
MRGTPHTLASLRELGFLYHIDDVSRDEPFLISVTGQPFVVVPYTIHQNDIVNYESRYFSTEQFLGDLKNEFDALYAEAVVRRRMMSISTHDRIAGRPARAKVFENFINYAQKRAGAWFARKDEIARWALASPITSREDEATT